MPSTPTASPYLRPVPSDGPITGTGASLEQLYRQHSPFVARIAFRLMGRDDEVEDVVQDVFFELVRRHDALNCDEPLQGWLAKVAVRNIGKRLKRRRLRRVLGIRRDAAYDSLATLDAPHEQRIELKKLYTALDKLGVEERLAWMLRHLEGERLDVVAQRCEVSLATAKRRIAAAHNVLRTELGYG